jgi:hypothetical protein
VLRKNIDTIEKAAEATGSLITEGNKAKYTIGIFWLLYEVYNIFWPICAHIKVLNVTY